jgi:hypothetical protein
MQGDTAERWRKLCEQAAIEQDPQKVLELSEGLTVYSRPKSRG